MLHIVIATLNNIDYVRRAIDGIVASTDVGSARVVIVDNGSGGDATEYLRSIQSEGVALIPNAANLGVASAWNQGIRFSLLNGADKVLVCGSDTVAHPGTIKRLADLIDSGIPFVTGTQVPYGTKPGENIPQRLLAAPDFSFFMLSPLVIGAVANFDMRQTKQESQIHPWMMGIFDERFAPAYFEDNDYHHRMKESGILAVRDEGALFNHDCSLTLRTHTDLQETNNRTFQVNAEKFRAKWGGLPHEVGILGARPLNVSDEQWNQMTGGREVSVMDPKAIVAQAKAVYTQYNIPCP